MFICGNGGSAVNAIHLAKDFLYGIAKHSGCGMKIHALSANQAVITCLTNDLGYDHIYSEQLTVLGQSSDLMVLSGNSNSPNILCALEQAKSMGVRSFAILSYKGGHCKSLADSSIHCEVDSMQIAKGIQLVIGFMIMKWLYLNRPNAS